MVAEATAQNLQWQTTFPKTLGLPGAVDIPVGIAGAAEKVYVGGSMTIPDSAGTWFAAARYDVGGPPGLPQIADALATWPAKDDQIVRPVRAMTFVKLLNSVVLTGETPSAINGRRVITTVCFGNDSSGLFTTLWSRIEDDIDDVEDPPDDEAVGVVSLGSLVAVTGRSAVYGTGMDMVVHVYDATTGAKVMPSKRWTGAGIQDDIAAGVALIPTRLGTAVVVGGTTPIGGGRSRIVLMGWHATAGAPWPPGTELLGAPVFSTPPPGYSDRAVAQAPNTADAEDLPFTVVAGVRGEVGGPDQQDYIAVMAESLCPDPCLAQGTLTKIWETAWDNPAPGAQADLATAVTIYHVIGGDQIPASYRVAVTGTTPGNGADIHTVSLNGATGCPEWYHIIDRTGNEFPSAISSVVDPVDPLPNRRLAITGGTSDALGDVDVFNASYNAELEPNAPLCGTPPPFIPLRLPLWAQPPNNFNRFDGDGYDAGVAIHILRIGLGTTPSPHERAIFAVVRYVGNSVADEWAIHRIFPQ